MLDLPTEGAALLDATAVAERCGYSTRTIRRWTSAARIPFVGPRSRPRYIWPEVVEALRAVSRPQR